MSLGPPAAVKQFAKVLSKNATPKGSKQVSNKLVMNILPPPKLSGRVIVSESKRDDITSDKNKDSESQFSNFFGGKMDDCMKSALKNALTKNSLDEKP